jgi:dsDNA-binding SOS-regulon protein
MWSPARIKDVQKLTGCLTTLSRFISRLAEWDLPFFKLLRKSGPFVWTNDAEEAFQELKRYLTSPPVMVAPETGEPLLLYIAATSEAVSMVLVAERPDPHAPHELESSSADGSGSLDPRPTEEPRTDAIAGSQSLVATMGPPNQGVTGSPGSEPLPGVKGRELPGPTPMEIDAPNSPQGWGGGPSNVRCTS